MDLSSIVFMFSLFFISVLIVVLFIFLKKKYEEWLLSKRINELGTLCRNCECPLNKEKEETND